MSKNAQRIVGVLTLVAWWVFTVVRMWLDAQRDLGPTGLPNDIPNWHNRPGDLWQFVAISAGELLVVLLVLRPQHYLRSWGRALSAFGLLTPWTLLFVAMLLHSGGIMKHHFLWLVVVWMALAGLSVLSGIGALVHWQRVRREPAT